MNDARTAGCSDAINGTPVDGSYLLGPLTLPLRRVAEFHDRETIHPSTPFDCLLDFEEHFVSLSSYLITANIYL